MSSRGDCMSSIKKLAVLSMLAVALIAFCMPASAAIGAGVGASSASTAGISAASSVSATSAGIGLGGIGLGGIGLGGIGLGGFGAFGGFGFPFNWGFSQLGIGAFPFNWGLGAGLGPFGLGWNQFSPGFGAGSFFSPCFLGSTCQALPFILGNEGFVQGLALALRRGLWALVAVPGACRCSSARTGSDSRSRWRAWGASLIPPVSHRQCCPPFCRQQVSARGCPLSWAMRASVPGLALALRRGLWALVAVPGACRCSSARTGSDSRSRWHPGALP